MNHKGQAALEFLTTYGWAFLIIVIMIGTLTYFGIFNPGQVLPNRCTFGTEFQCVDYQISATGNTFKLKLRNNVGDPLTVDQIVLNSDNGAALLCVPQNPSAYPWTETWRSGNTSDFEWNGCNFAAVGLNTGSKGKVLVTIRYYSVASGSNYIKEAKGDIYSNVI